MYEVTGDRRGGLVESEGLGSSGKGPTRCQQLVKVLPQDRSWHCSGALSMMGYPAAAHSLNEVEHAAAPVAVGPGVGDGIGAGVVPGVGHQLGDRVGPGLAIRDRVGPRVGARDVGARLGATVGVEVGARLGATVGVEVVAAVGVGVGGHVPVLSSQKS